MKKRLIMLATASFVAPAAAQAAFIDFEAQGASAPAFISPNTGPQTLTIAGATFSGGQLVKATDDFLDPDLGDLTAAYTTFDYVTTLHTLNPLTIAFAVPVSAISFELVNNIAGNYQVTTNLGFNQTFSVGDYANQFISLSGPGISTVTVRYSSTPTVGPFFDFALDNISFASAAAVPEPASWAMMIVGLALTGATLRRRRRIVRRQVI